MLGTSSGPHPQAVGHKELEPADMVNPDFARSGRAQVFDKSDPTGAVSNSSV